ncbi:ANL family adenylate-forming protein [Winogradskyella sp. MIT101101]|uniref:ANL family adenylate-forming protein n=1 Tax=Winogradskyella sp. MIT101101 TaxID=3098297 RepID=UPI003999E678
MISKIIKPHEGTSVIDGSGSYSFDELSQQVNKFKVSVNNIFKQHDRVLLYSDYTFHSVALLICLAEFPINVIPLVKTTESEYQDKLQSVSPHYILSFNGDNELNINPYSDTDDTKDSFNEVTSKGDTGIVLFSSGTTGKPKVMIQNFTELIKSIKPPRRQKSLVFILLLMFDHIGGINTLLNCLISGAPFVIPKDRNPSTIISLIEKHRVHILPTTPTFLNLMLMDESFYPEKLKSLKLITYGTERMSDSLLAKINASIPNVRLLQTFGTSETGILKTKSKSSTSLFFKIIDEDKEYKIVDGELYLRSKTQIKGYLNHENNNFKNDGWYATGDLVEEDNEGYIKIIGRKNKVINVGGLKVLPKEIEDVLNAIDGVDESSVFGEQNNIVGHIVCAKIFTQLENHKALKSEIKSVCRQSLDKYKMPVKFYFEKLAMNQRGKKC